MLPPRVAIRYAKAALQLAVEQDVLEPVLKDMQLVNKTCHGHKDLNIMLNSPVIKLDVKQRIFGLIFADKLQKLSYKFFEIIIRKNREELIEDITKAFIGQYKEYKNIQTVHVATATPLSDENRAELMDFLKTRTKEEIILVEDIEEEIIGGIVVRMRDVQIDASVKTNISRLEREFSKDLYTIKY